MDHNDKHEADERKRWNEKNRVSKLTAEEFATIVRRLDPETTEERARSEAVRFVGAIETARTIAGQSAYSLFCIVAVPQNLEGTEYEAYCMSDGMDGNLAGIFAGAPLARMANEPAAMLTATLNAVLTAAENAPDRAQFLADLARLLQEEENDQ